MNTPGYESLSSVLHRAFDQAAKGKGAERHATNLPFDKQPMQLISDQLGSPIGLAYQAIKKIQESQRMDTEARVRELLGAINYIAGIIVFLEKEGKAQALTEKYQGLLNPMVGQANQHPVRNRAWTCNHRGTHFAEGGTFPIPATPIPFGGACPTCGSAQV